ncbi:penicillin-binding protein activator LpoB [Intestinicryptomonas porci]|uniref:Penicillin-binding protein activator LpoB n=1 Tax=Intestinicryptomonas porci TaxID=2926320 RepID=A0ABU4WKT0_9BACT|nr:penicillin-binding protein activator LpoB [Opitutales bacterium CLA-KB-P66]
MKTIYASTAILLSSLVISGCASDNASYVESGGARSIITTNKINIADWNSAASALINDMLSSGALEKTGETQPVKMLVSRIRNSTSEVIDVEMLTRRVAMTLTNSGKVRVVSSIELAEYEAEAKGKKISKPKITLTGKISEDRESNSSAREVTYTFSLELNHRGSPVWIGEKQITKQSSKGMFGL